MKVITYSNLSKIIIRYDNHEKLYVKTTYDERGIQNLKNEFDGLKWYFSKKPEIRDSFLRILKIRSNKNFAKIEIPFIEGYKIPVERDISKNKSFLYKAINEYVYISGQKNFRFHGDFSMGNLIFNLSNTYIIDWEHSNDEIKIWGIDILNIFYESLFFSFKKKDYLSKKNLKSAIEVYQYISNIFSDSDKKMMTIKNLIRFYKKNSRIWGVSYSKLPVLKFNEIQLKIIKSIENSK